MRYYVIINKRFRYMRVYNVLKRINDNSNKLSRGLASLVDKFLLKKKTEL